MIDPAPFVLSRSPNGQFGLTLETPALLAVIDVFRESEHEGNGYAWQAIAEHLMAVRAPDIAEAIEHDPEAGMYAAYSSSLEAIERLAALLSEVYRDRKLLQQLIAELGDRLDD